MSDKFPPKIFAYWDEFDVEAYLEDPQIVNYEAQQYISMSEHEALLQQEREKSESWEQLANAWMKDYDKLKQKYEPLVGVI